MVVSPLSLSASMTRWKPSVNSRSGAGASAPAGFDVLTAASAMGGLPDVVLVEIIGMPGDVVDEPERMVAHELLGARSIARLDRLDDVHMVADRAVGAVLLADGLAPDHPHVGEQIGREIDQHAVLAQPDDGLVELDVDLGIFVELGVQVPVLEGREHR